MIGFASLVLSSWLVAAPGPQVQQWSTHVERTFRVAGFPAPSRDQALDRVCETLAKRQSTVGIRQRVRKLRVYDGIVIPVVVDGADRPKVLQSLKRYIADHLIAHGITRYGVAVKGQRVILLFVRRVLRLQTWPTPKRRGEVVPLYGTLSPGFHSARLLVARPDGRIDTHRARISGGKLRAAIPFYGPGRYAVEIMAQGPRGNEVLALIHTTVGGKRTTQPFVPTTVTQGPRHAEELLLRWINQARRRLKLRPLRADPTLQSTARHHARSMAAMRMAAHVLPGGHGARVRLEQAGVRVKRFFENVALAVSAEQAHRELWESPSHRKAILDPKITHVGIGAVVVRSEAGPTLYICEHLAKR